MKKRIFAAILAATLLLSLLVACSSKPASVVGTYTGTYTYEGNQFEVTIVLGEDNQYTYVSYKNGQSNKTQSGEYDLKGSEVRCYDPSVPNHGSHTAYKYSAGTLENNGHVFRKK